MWWEGGQKRRPGEEEERPLTIVPTSLHDTVTPLKLSQYVWPIAAVEQGSSLVFKKQSWSSLDKEHFGNWVDHHIDTPLLFLGYTLCSVKTLREGNITTVLLYPHIWTDCFLKFSLSLFDLSSLWHCKFRRTLKYTFFFTMVICILCTIYPVPWMSNMWAVIQSYCSWQRRRVLVSLFQWLNRTEELNIEEIISPSPTGIFKNGEKTRCRESSLSEQDVT